ncbi:nudix hydrolase 2-like [Vigna unguiculata]|uniref:nudix hydrolase 2-like n=1 Tax=Vigna unguiculata TaxID=3917 RepID=UPI0010168C1F|nr:nudix hydrolase 2-like [Vigna unguiculata]XP_027940770.1 nudix hydrolase 2-like [Vigna unguiculata]
MEGERVELLSVVEDQYDGVIVNVENQEHVDSELFSSILKASIYNWKQQGKKGVWLKLFILHSNLVDTAVKAGFRYHHAEPDYLMLVRWIPETPDTFPANASHRVGVAVLVVNDKKEMLVVQERGGIFRGTGLWKMPTGVVNEGEDLCDGAIREVKEETGIETKFVEVLAFRQSHKSFFEKSDLMFVCMVEPLSSDIQIQASEIEAAQWMPIEDYAAQPFVQEHENFDFVAKVCSSKLDGNYTGFSNVLMSTSSGKKTYLYLSNRDASVLLASKQNQA